MRYSKLLYSAIIQVPLQYIIDTNWPLLASSSTTILIFMASATYFMRVSIFVEPQKGWFNQVNPTIRTGLWYKQLPFYV